MYEILTRNDWIMMIIRPSLYSNMIFRLYSNWEKRLHFITHFWEFENKEQYQNEFNQKMEIKQILHLINDWQLTIENLTKEQMFKMFTK